MKSFARRDSPDLDLTPLIDVMFMLILFFVLAASFDRSGLSVDLPRGRSQEATGAQPFILTVRADGGIFLGGRRIGPDEATAAALSASAHGRSVTLAGDGGAPYRAVAELLDRLREAGLRSVGLLYREVGSGGGGAVPVPTGAAAP
jgi:biopolymer transport protein ExbD